METQAIGHDLLTDDELKFSHKFCLTKPYILTCVSQTLCEMLGYTEAEIATLFHNDYVEMVYPDDRDRFVQYLDQLASSEKTLALRYRMVRKDGEIIHISDIMFSHLKQDGNMYGFAVIVDITDSIQAESAYHLFNMPASAIPFGYLQCTCEKYPKVLCINNQMLSFLGESQDTPEWTEFLRDNIFFMLPFDDRDLFRSYLEKALNSSEPIKIRHRIIQRDGARVEVVGWLGTILNHEGEKEYSIIYTDVLNSASASSHPTENSYFKALQSAYNIIFEINLVRQTVECLYGRDTSDIGKLYDIRMTVESARNFWLSNYIVDDDRSHVAHYFDEIIRPGAVANAKNPMQTEFRIAWDDHRIYSFIAVAIQLDASSILLCCRDTEKVQYSSMQAREIRAMKKLHSYMDRAFENEKGAAAAAILERDDDDFCNLIYASKSVFNYFSLRYDQYLHYIEEGFHFSELEKIASENHIPDFQELFNGKKITIRSKDTNEEITLVCNQQSPYLYEIIATKTSPQTVAGVPSSGTFARTFGYFDLFVNGRAVVFSNYKEKELMALLIDRNGGTLTSSDAISYLWEDEIPDERMKTRFRKLAMGLKRTLQEYGIEDILINHNGVRSVDPGKFTCDYYELLAGNAQYIHSFHNSYMTDYSWSERTLGTLWDFS